MNPLVLDLLFAIVVVTALAAICRLGHGVAGGLLDDAAAPVELPRRDESRRAA